MTTTAVIGAGPAGMMAAISAAEPGQTTLFEKNASPGRKLLITGAGQCNLTHTGSITDFLTRYKAAGRFLRPALYHLDPESLLDFFRQRGVEFETEASGKIFPVSRRAAQLLDILQAELDSRGVERIFKTPITSVELVKGLFRLSGTDGFCGTSRSLVIAAGGCSYPATGSNGSGFRLAAGLGHSIVSPHPGLTDIEIEEFPLTKLAGISLRDCRISYFSSGTLKEQLRGDLLITHRGFSGPAILNASGKIRPGDELVPDFGGLGAETETRILAWAAANGRKQLASLARLTAAPEKLTGHLLESAGLAIEKRLSELSRSDRRRIVAALRERRYRVSTPGGFARAMITAGGVARDEINPKTMESRIVKGLYFAGEVIDIDGDTGGYNLQAAFATGSLAGKSAAS